MMKEISTVKRKANVGERILITNADDHRYTNGDIAVVESFDHNSVFTEEFNGHGCVCVYDREYEVIIENEEAGGMKTRYDLAVENARGAIEELRLAAYEAGYMDAVNNLNAVAPVSTSTPQQIRDEIVAKAKADVEDLNNGRGDYNVPDPTSPDPWVCVVKFIVNTEKRTVVALLKGKISDKLRAKGIAKADPSDCFNVHLGKAIALRRALGLEVPAEYYSAPAPTEVRVGDVVQGKYYRSEQYYTDTVAEIVDNRYQYTSGGWDAVDDNDLKIIDDSREG